MKHDFLRRLGALTLALALALTMAVTPAMAVGGDEPRVDITPPGPLELTVGGSGMNLAASVAYAPMGADFEYKWETSDSTAVELTTVEANPSTVTVTPISAAESVTVTVKVTWPENTTGITASCTLKVAAAATANVPVTGITVTAPSAEMTVGDPDQTLTASITPANASNKGVKWSSDNTPAATVNETTGVVHAVGVGVATITATAQDGSGVTGSCTITVKAKTPVTTEPTLIGFSGNETLSEKESKRIYLDVTPADADVADVDWTSSNDSVVTVVKITGNPTQATLGAVAPGEATITASIPGTKLTATCKVEVSGLVLSCPNNSTMTGSTMTLLEKQNDTLVATPYGDAKGGTAGVKWSSGNNAVATVGSNGLVKAQSKGSTTITATRGNYSATCTVTVEEDTSALINLGSVNAGNEISLGSINSQLYAIARRKGMTGVDYITNLSVPTSQGILHYNYLYEGDTGAGVGTEQYYLTSTLGKLELSRLSFVPRTDYSGTVDISYTAWRGNSSFSGVIRVTVNAMGDVSYSTAANTPVSFQAYDFNAACHNKTGRDLQYVTFTLPQASSGTLYYNYVGAGQTGSQVSGNTEYKRSGIPALDNVTFVPAQGCPSTVRISYRGVDMGNISFSGYVTITVGGTNGTYSSADVHYSTPQGQQIIFQASDFNNACWATINEPLSYVRFSQVSSSQGTLYYNYRGNGGYDSYVSAGTSYYQSGAPSIGGISFVPSANMSGQAAFGYTGYGTGGTTYTGVVYVDIGSSAQRGIQYNTYSGKVANFSSYDFTNVCSGTIGGTLDHIQFTSLPTSNQGTLYYNYSSSTSWNTQVSTWNNYYRIGSYSGQNLINGISFLANKDYTGTVSISYVGYNTSNSRFEGTVTIQVNTPAPNDVNLSTPPSTPIKLSSSTLRSVCSAVLDQELYYIQINTLPASTAGTLYSSYSAGGGTQAGTNTRYYRSGTPNIDQLTFVPRSGYEGTAVIGYTGVSTTGQQVSGRINIRVSRSSSSRYFNDMAAHQWAVDAVDYLYQNGVVNGMGNGGFGPGLSIRRCDFVVMLCRAFNLTGYSGYSFADVPAESYYGAQVATAKRLGIVSGDGVNFYPGSSLTRQDAMVMINNTLKATGHDLTNGLTADLSIFKDNTQISGYARSSVGILVYLGAVQGDGNGMLRPRGTINRAEAAKLIQFIMAM